MKTGEFLVGSAIGDAFGVGVEMQGRETLKDITFDRWHNMRTGKHGEGYHSGEYSDDTEHIVGLIKALISKENFTEDLLVRYWKEEYDQDKERKGYPRQGHGSIKEYYNGELTIEDLRLSQSQREHPGNAPVMRAAPLGFLPKEVLFNYAEINANATHPHPEALMASELVAVTSHFLLNGGDHKGLLKYCSQKTIFRPLRTLLLSIDKFDTPERIYDTEYEKLLGKQPIKGAGGEINGLPCSALPTALTALYLLKHTDNPYLGLQRSIKIGGDVDTLATICVGILSGRYGLSSLPDFMQNEVEGKEMLTELGKQFEEFLKSN
jgi:ADP-ribosylglycohydrolase